MRGCATYIVELSECLLFLVCKFVAVTLELNFLLLVECNGLPHLGDLRFQSSVFINLLLEFFLSLDCLALLCLDLAHESDDLIALLVETLSCHFHLLVPVFAHSRMSVDLLPALLQLFPLIVVDGA